MTPDRLYNRGSAKIATGISLLIADTGIPVLFNLLNLPEAVNNIPYYDVITISVFLAGLGALTWGALNRRRANRMRQGL